MAENELIIVMKMDRSLAEKEASAFHCGEKARIAKTLTDAEVAEKAKTELIKRENKQRIDLIARSTKTQVELDREAAEAKKRLEKEAADAKAKLDKEAARESKRLLEESKRAAKAAADAKAKLDRESADETKRLLRDVERAAKASAKAAADDAKQWDKRSLTDKEIVERAKSDLIRRENRTRVQATVQANEEERRGVGRLAEAWGAKGGAIGMSAKAVGGYVAAFSVVGAGLSILNALEEKWRAVARGAMEAAKSAAISGKAHLELSGFAGTPGQTVAEQQKTMQLVAQSGLSPEEATSLRKAAGTGAYPILDRAAIPARNGMPAIPAREGYMSPQEMEIAQVYAARQAVVSGGAAADYGKAAAMIPALHKKRMTGKEVGGELVKLDRFAMLGEYETPSDMIKQIEVIQGYVKSGVVSPDEASAMIALAAKTNKEEAGTLVMQAIHAVSAGTIQARGMHVADELKADMVTSADYFKSLGVGLNARVPDALEAVAQDIMKLPAGTNPDQYLLQHGVNNQESRRAMLAMAGDLPLYREQLKPLMSMKIGPEAIDAPWDAHIKGDPVGREAMANAGVAAAENLIGQKTMGLRQAMMQEYALLVAKGAAPKDSFEEYAAPNSINPWTQLPRWATGSQANTLLSPIARRLTDEMQRLGIETDLGSDNDGTRTSTFDVLTGTGDMKTKTAVFDRAMAAIKGAGGDTSLGGNQMVQDLVDLTRGMHDSLKTIANNTAKNATAGGARPVQPKAP